MKERPFNAYQHEVRAILDGRMTQFRRAVKPQPYAVSLVQSGNHLFDYRNDLNDYIRVVDMKKAVTLCPYGQIGDLLWGREKWRFSDSDPNSIEYAATRSALAEGIDEATGVRWKPSIHMPRWASRFTLEVTGVRVERLGEISESDARAEGVQSVAEFKELWASINGLGSWEANPWVWVVKFKRIKP